MNINDLSAEAIIKLRDDGIASDKDLLDTDMHELPALELAEDDMAKIFFIRNELAKALGKGEDGNDKPRQNEADIEVPDDARETFEVNLLPRHAQWINDVVAARMASDASHAIEQCIRAAMVNDTDRVGRRAGGTVKADEFDADA